MAAAPCEMSLRKNRHTPELSDMLSCRLHLASAAARRNATSRQRQVRQSVAATANSHRLMPNQRVISGRANENTCYRSRDNDSTLTDRQTDGRKTGNCAFR